jgi:hypothetical protein
MEWIGEEDIMVYFKILSLHQYSMTRKAWNILVNTVVTLSDIQSTDLKTYTVKHIIPTWLC